LEAFEINFDCVDEITFYESSNPIYDLCVKDNYSYVVTKKDIIVHNSKSFLMSLWLMKNSIRYPGTRWLLGRAHLKSLKESTLLTLLDVMKVSGLKADKHFHYNSIEGRIKFYNESEIFLKDLFLYPSDPQFDSLGSTEFTGAGIDECAEVTEMAKNIVMSRLRYKLDDYGLIPKLLMCSNPAKNFTYAQFYRAQKEGTIESYRVFVPALVTDNPFISPHYIENLHKLDGSSKERLLFGNWEYDDDPSKLYEYEDILDMFTRPYTPTGDLWLINDIARFGNDKTVLTLWDGLYVIKMWSFSKKSTEFTARFIESIEKAYPLRRSHIIIDEDGIGGGVVDQLPGCVGFVNNSTPIKPRVNDPNKITFNYTNLKSQCHFTLAQYVKRGLIGVYPGIPVEYKNSLIQEMEQIKRKDPDKDNKLAVVGKEAIKEHLGRSPDYSDTFMMRMKPELNKTDRVVVGFL